MGRLAKRLQRAGAKRITLMPLSACDVRFGSTPAPPAADHRDFDVVFIGSRPGRRNFTSHLYWSGRRRLRYVELLEERYGHRFALFGHGWSGRRSWQGPIDFDEQALVPQRGRVVFGGYPGSRCDYYASNRPFNQVLSGTPMVDHAVPRVDCLFRDGDEWLLFDDEGSAIDKIDSLLDGRIDGAQVGARGADAVRNRHLDSHRARLIIAIVDEIGEAQRAHRTAVCPPLDFFHAGIDYRSEVASALRRW
jgi:hypothetical protein